MKKTNIATIAAGAMAMVLVSANSSPLPFLETFEVADGVTNGTINGQNGWVLESGTAEVQSGISQAGSQALQMQNAGVTHALSSDGSALWLHFQALCPAVPTANPDGTIPHATIWDRRRWVAVDRMID